VAPVGDGYEIHEDARLQMALLGATTPATIRTTARVDGAFGLRSFEFSLDPGTGPTEISGTLNGRTLALTIKNSSGTTTETRELAEPPVLAISLARRLAAEGMVAGARHQWAVFDPATMRNAPVVVQIGSRDVVFIDGRPVPAFKVDMAFAGLRTSSWITDTGDVVREESPLGMISVRENPQVARSLAVPGRGRTDLLEGAAVKPVMRRRIDDARDVRRLRLRIEGADLSGGDLQGAGQAVSGDIVEIRDAQGLKPSAADPDAVNFLAAEPFIESDAPEIKAEAEKAIRGAADPRARAERLTRYVNALLEKKPTVSLPSAREVLRTKIGDCNEHTALYVAMARAIGLPARIAVGLTFVRGAFYYHAWPEVYLAEGRNSGVWLPVDPTLNQFPADATHVRLARGGLDRQAAILPLMGRLKITVTDLELAPNSTPVIVGRPTINGDPLPLALPPRKGDCWSSLFR
ncbi:MAG TPA: transglutaminase-like domain-containing protein, partial [Vicinamibacterales bacterium]